MIIRKIVIIIFLVKSLSFIVNKRIIDEFDYIRNKCFKTRTRYASSSIIIIINVISYRKKSILKIENINFK